MHKTSGCGTNAVTALGGNLTSDFFSGWHIRGVTGYQGEKAWLMWSCEIRHRMSIILYIQTFIDLTALLFVSILCFYYFPIM